MNLQRCLVLVVGIVFGLVNATMAQDTPWHFNFEEVNLSSAYRAADAGSQLSLSTRHYKSGRQSLRWSWRNGSRLLFTDPEPERKKKLIAFRAWVYCEEALADATLTFGLGTQAELSVNNPRYQFEFGLNFTGWRAMWIELAEDATNVSYTGSGKGKALALDIRAPDNIPSGSVYLDLVEMDRDIRRGAPDLQVPYINGGAAENREYRWSLNTLPGPVPAQITEEERRAFETIVERYETWVLGNNVKEDRREPVQVRLNTVSRIARFGHRNLEKYEIRREGDVILGVPLFASRSPYSPHFESIFQNVLLRLVLDYRLNGDSKLRDDLLDLFDYLHDQGWAWGSGLGTLHHEFLRIAGYAHAVFLMREDLRATGRLEREGLTLEWHSMFGEVYEENWDPGTNADFLRSVGMYRLLRVLMMDDTPEKVTMMRCYLAWLDNALSIAPGWLDTIKPDYSGFHHRGIYANAYAPNAFHIASLLVYLLRDTPFAVADDKRENVKQALLTTRVIANTYDISSAINGRFPLQTSAADKLLPAYMYTAMSYTPVDAELSGTFMRLWRPELPILQELFDSASPGIMYVDTPGSIQMMVNFAEANHSPPEASPSGHWTLPYGAFSIHRRDEWMVSMKGWSKYVWDFESGNDGSNQLGRYLSYGSMLIYGNGDPVTREASGIVPEGWDWSMWPGTTVIRLSHPELGEYRRDRNFSDETFAGGVNIGGQNGVFALKLHDTQHNPSFRAVKTVFCFDDVLVCLGSGIENDDGGHATVTPLFQASISEDRPTGVNGESVRAIPYTFSGTPNQKEWLMDASGNGYVIPNGDGLRVQRKMQEPAGGFKKSYFGGKGTFELAYLDHGNAPSNEGYEYAVLVQQPLSRIRKFSDAPEYVVWQRDAQAHIVHHPKLKTTGYAVLDVGARPANGALVSVDMPSLVMTRKVSDGLLLSISDPDFGWNWIIQDPHRQNETLVVNQPSVPRKVTVTVRGQWDLEGANALAQVTDVQSDRTMVEFTCQDGKTVEVKLVWVSALSRLDFDGNGVVDTRDFLMFINNFGLSEGDVGFEAKYDLDGNGIVGVSDFIIFSEGYGKRMSGKPVALRNGGERLGS